jgi:hypothetical protein
MADTARIIVRIGRDGTISAETKGMRGQRCLDSIQVLEDLLDAETVSSAFTNEYYTATESQEDELGDELEQR